MTPWTATTLMSSAARWTTRLPRNHSDEGSMSAKKRITNWLQGRPACQRSSVIRLSDFSKFLGTTSSSKSCLNIWWLLELFWKIPLWNKNSCSHFLGSFWKNWATFYFNIWSQCSVHTIAFYKTWNGRIARKHYLILKCTFSKKKS